MIPAPPSPAPASNQQPINVAAAMVADGGAMLNALEVHPTAVAEALLAAAAPVVLPTSRGPPPDAARIAAERAIAEAANEFIPGPESSFAPAPCSSDRPAPYAPMR